MKRGLLACLFAVCAGAARAETFKILGPRPLGMGGAFVAIAEGGLAQYWNPAGLDQKDAENSKWGVQLPVGAEATFTGGVLQDANTLGNMSSQFQAIQSAQKSGTAGAMDATKMGAFVQALPTIADLNHNGKGALADVEGGAEVKIGRFAVSVNNFTSIGASPFVDTTNIGLGNGGTGIAGLSYAGVATGAPAAQYTTSRNSIQTAIDTIGFASLNSLICGSAACLSAQNAGLNSSTNLANALVNAAVTNGQSAQQIQDAASQMAQNAAGAAPIIQSGASGKAYTNNQTNLTLRGASLTEIAFGYGRQFFVPGLSLGGNLKLIRGQIGYSRYNVLTNDAGSTNALKNFRDSSAVSVAPAVDLGALWKLNQVVPVLPFNPRVGIVAKNINNPKFDQPATAIANGEGSKYAENAQLRMGLAVSPLHFWNIAADMDLTDNLTPVNGYHSRMFGLGTEVNVFNRSWINIPLRAGIMKNLADTGSALSYTAGFGINFLHFMVDVGGAISADQTTINTQGNSQKVPQSAAGAAQLAFMF